MLSNTIEEVKRLFARFDLDGNGFLTKEEFCEVQPLTPTRFHLLCYYDIPHLSLLDTISTCVTLGTYINSSETRALESCSTIAVQSNSSLVPLKVTTWSVGVWPIVC